MMHSKHPYEWPAGFSLKQGDNAVTLEEVPEYAKAYVDHLVANGIVTVASGILLPPAVTPSNASLPSDTTDDVPGFTEEVPAIADEEGGTTIDSPSARKKYRR